MKQRWIAFLFAGTILTAAGCRSGMPRWDWWRSAKSSNRDKIEAVAKSEAPKFPELPSANATPSTTEENASAGSANLAGGGSISPYPATGASAYEPAGAGIAPQTSPYDPNAYGGGHAGGNHTRAADSRYSGGGYPPTAGGGYEGGTPYDAGANNGAYPTAGAGGYPPAGAAAPADDRYPPSGYGSGHDPYANPGTPAGGGYPETGASGYPQTGTGGYPPVGAGGYPPPANHAPAGGAPGEYGGSRPYDTGGQVYPSTPYGDPNAYPATGASYTPARPAAATADARFDAGYGAPSGGAGAPADSGYYPAGTRPYEGMPQTSPPASSTAPGQPNQQQAPSDSRYGMFGKNSAPGADPPGSLC